MPPGPWVSINLEPPRMGVLASSFCSLVSRALRSSLSFLSVSIVDACRLMKLIMNGIVKSVSP